MLRKQHDRPAAKESSTRTTDSSAARRPQKPADSGTSTQKPRPNGAGYEMPRRDFSNLTCYKCGKKGHLKLQCPEASVEELCAWDLSLQTLHISGDDPVDEASTEEITVDVASTKPADFHWRRGRPLHRR
ncbi:hypothetical protein CAUPRSCDRAFT_12932 [Caulochytrium protostelioides]|uniref:CCHC-type domain-containing protein n=1 Tax=Caulochytrium protostelioides TaxID=1555241 RepID=A0A4P9WQD5_9FUNG|nr:hypothetical protein CAUPRSCDRAFT_12932 [Caulochytrium protostelioides]